MSREDPNRIEAQVLDEIKAVLGMSRPLYDPPSTITIPGTVATSSGSPSSVDEELVPERQEYLLPIKDDHKLPPMEEHAPPARHTDQDSFLQRVSDMSHISMGSISSSLNSSQRFYIGALPEDQEANSIPSHADELEGAEELERDELMEVIQRLYESLKGSDDQLALERRKRNSREKSLIKLAKELSKRKSAMEEQTAVVKQLEEELESLRAENDLLTQRLQSNQRRISTAQAQDQQDNLAVLREGFQQLQVKYDRAAANHDARIRALNQQHATQCDQLCKEVVQANQESVRLQQALLQTRQGSFEKTMDAANVTVRKTTVLHKTTKVFFYWFLLFVACGAYLSYCLEDPLIWKEVMQRRDALWSRSVDVLAERGFQIPPRLAGSNATSELSSPEGSAFREDARLSQGDFARESRRLMQKSAIMEAGSTQAVPSRTIGGALPVPQDDASKIVAQNKATISQTTPEDIVVDIPVTSMTEKLSVQGILKGSLPFFEFPSSDNTLKHP